MAMVETPMWVPPGSKKREKGKRKRSLNFRVPDEVLAYVESEGRNKTDVAVELIELAIDFKKGLGKDGWRDVFFRSLTEETSPGKTAALMLLEGLACIKSRRK